MMTTRLSMTQLERLQTVMRRMLSEVDNANWPEVSRLDRERRVILDYPEDGSASRAPNSGTPAISSGSRPLSLIPPVLETDESQPASANQTVAGTGSDALVDERYRALSRDVMSLDQAIKARIDEAKVALLQESRELRAQTKARNGYAQTRDMKFRSYS